VARRLDRRRSSLGPVSPVPAREATMAVQRRGKLVMGTSSWAESPSVAFCGTAGLTGIQRAVEGHSATSSARPYRTSHETLSCGFCNFCKFRACICFFAKAEWWSQWGSNSASGTGVGALSCKAPAACEHGPYLQETPMGSPNAPSNPATETSAILHRLIDRLEEAWQRGEQPRCRSLPSHGTQLLPHGPGRAQFA
jgi:hypothetical protein